MSFEVSDQVYLSFGPIVVARCGLYTTIYRGLSPTSVDNFVAARPLDGRIVGLVFRAYAPYVAGSSARIRTGR